MVTSTSAPKSKQYAHRIDKVLGYIRNNVGAPLRLETLARVACLSPYHFHRIFHAVMGERLHQYVARVRLESAALRLTFTRESTTGIGTDCGYSRVYAFSKAFKKHFGVAPANYKGSSVAKKTYVSRATLPVLAPREQVCPPRRLLYVKRAGPYRHAADAAWRGLMSFVYEHDLFSAASEQIGVTYDSPVITRQERIQYDACITSDADIRLQGVVGRQTLSGGRFVVFTHVGPYEDLGRTYDAIYSDWLFKSGVSLRNTPSFAKYLDDVRFTEPEKLRTEIYLPIK